MIQLANITKSFGRMRALDDVSFTVGSGEVIGFLGPNGAGKTTTMRIITGYLHVDVGSVTVGKYDPREDRVAVARKIGYLPENNPLYTDMIAFEYLQFIEQIKSTNTNKSSGKLTLKEIVSVCNVAPVLGKPIGDLSRGYRQRVGLAAALIANPSILILDEPTSGLDPIEQDTIHQLIKELGKKKTILLSTHILDEVEKICTRVIIINKGHIVHDAPVQKKKGVLEKVFKAAVSGMPVKRRTRVRKTTKSTKKSTKS